MSVVESEFGKRVRAVRTDRRMSQHQLGQLIGLDASAITRLESGQRAVRLGEAVAIAEAVDIGLPWLVYGRPYAPGGGTEPRVLIRAALMHALELLEGVNE